LAELSGQTFIGTRLIEGYRIVEIDDALVVDSFARLDAVVSSRAGRNVAALFAEPRISRGNGAAPARIDWYARFDGVIRPFDQLDPSSAAAVRRTLENRLAALRPLALDPDCGPLVAAALNVASPEAIVSVGGDPVLIDWGLLPPAALSDERSRAAHFAATVGRFMPDFPVPPLSRAEWLQRFAASGSPSAAAPAPAAPAPAVPRAASTAEDRRSFRAPIVALAIAAIVFAFLMIPGVLSFSADQRSVTHASRKAEIARSVTEQMQARRHQLEAALAADCPILLQSAGSLLPPRLADLRVGAQGSEFMSRVDAGTVLVLTETGAASGFFVTNDTILTIGQIADQRDVRVSNKLIGLVDAKVVAHGGGDAASGLDDLVLLRVTPQPKAVPFELGGAGERAQRVAAIGYPTMRPGADSAVERLRRGDAQASTSLAPAITEGSIGHIEPPGDGGVTLIVHGAEVSQGAGGGPIVDLCGRVLGMSTFGPEDETVIWRLALGSDGLSGFLQRNAVTPRLDTAACSPRTVASARQAPDQAKMPAQPGRAPEASPAATPPVRRN
jgi:hypothetical protein